MVVKTMREVIPGTKNASILLGVIKMEERRYEAAMIRTGISKFPEEYSNFPERKIFKAWIIIKRPTPKAKRVSFVVSKALGKTGTTKIGIKNTSK